MPGILVSASLFLSLAIGSMHPGSPRAAANAASGTDARPAQIILFRHAEKPANENDPHLSKAGRARAQRLVGYISGDAEVMKFGRPVALFATATNRHDGGVRTQETIAPLAASLKLKVRTPYLGQDYEKLARAILNDAALAGKTVVICWRHEELAALAGALGVRPVPPDWKGGDYQSVWIVRYDGNKARLISQTAP